MRSRIRTKERLASPNHRTHRTSSQSHSAQLPKYLPILICVLIVFQLLYLLLISVTPIPKQILDFNSSCSAWAILVNLPSVPIPTLCIALLVQEPNPAVRAPITQLYPDSPDLKSLVSKHPELSSFSFRNLAFAWVMTQKPSCILDFSILEDSLVKQFLDSGVLEKSSLPICRNPWVELWINHSPRNLSSPPPFRTLSFPHRITMDSILFDTDVRYERAAAPASSIGSARYLTVPAGLNDGWATSAPAKSRRFTTFWLNGNSDAPDNDKVFCLRSTESTFHRGSVPDDVPSLYLINGFWSLFEPQDSVFYGEADRKFMRMAIEVELRNLTRQFAMTCLSLFNSSETHQTPTASPPVIDLTEWSNAIKKWNPELVSSQVSSGIVPKAPSFRQLAENLFQHLEAFSLLSPHDAHMFSMWLAFLEGLDYRFPEVMLPNLVGSICPGRPVIKPPDLALLLPIGPELSEFRNLLYPSLTSFWPKNWLNLILIVDSDRKDHKNIIERLTDGFDISLISYATWNSKSFVSEFYHEIGYNRQQFLMFWADNFTSSEYIGFLDVDSVFVYPVQVEDIFEDGRKPHVLAISGKSSGVWADYALGTHFALGKLELLRCMTYFPVVIHRLHLQALRKHIEHLHKKPFNEVFKEFSKNPHGYSQFHIMCNFVWHFYHSEYSWHIQTREESRSTSFLPPQGDVFADRKFKAEMTRPKMRVATHWNYGPSAFDTVSEVIRRGQCYSIEELWVRHALKMYPERTDLKNELSPSCKDIDVYNAPLHVWKFEESDWKWDLRVDQEFKKRIERDVQCLSQQSAEVAGGGGG